MLAERGLERRIAHTTPHFLVVPATEPWDCGLGEGGPPGGSSGSAGPGGPGGPPAGGIPTILAVGGPGTPTTMEFPEETATMLPAGTHLVMQLHLFNTQADALDFTPSEAHLVRSDTPAQDLKPIGVALINDGAVQIPPLTSDVQGGYDCTAPAPIENVFAVWPHMHLLGKQLVYPVKAAVAKGGVIGVKCTYDNPTDKTVQFGMSTDDEMCTAFVYYYPAVDGFGFCQGGAGGSGP